MLLKSFKAMTVGENGIVVTGCYHYDNTHYITGYPYENFVKNFAEIRKYEIDSNKLGQFIGKYDIKGLPIYSNFDVVKFKYRQLCDSWKTIELIGVFQYNRDDLIFEIDMVDELNHSDYVSLYYNSDRMSDFEIIGHLYEKAE